MNRFTLIHRRVRRTVFARRRLLAALTAAAAVAAGLQAAAGPPAPKAVLVVAAHDIPGGTVVSAADLARVEFDPSSVPAGVLASPAGAVGRTTATPVRAGEPITDVRLVGGSMLAGYPGMVAVPVRIGDPGAVALLRIGDQVDVLAADPQGESAAVVVAADAPVIAIPDHEETGAAVVSGGLIVLAITDTTAQDLAAAGVSAYLSIVINR